MFGKPPPFLLGLTGGVASGKTTVADYLGKRGAYLIDADSIARQVVAPESPVAKKIKQLLGETYFLDDGHLNRPAIKKLIFNDPIIKKKYEAIIMPAIRQAILAAIEQIPNNVFYAVLVVPLLFEKGLDKYTDININVDLSVEEQIRRAVKRNPADATIIKKLIATQMSREARNSRADLIIDNSGLLSDLYSKIDQCRRDACRLLKAKDESENKIMD